VSERAGQDWTAVAGEVVKLRKERGMRQEDLAAIANVSVSVVGEIERVEIRTRRAPGLLKGLSVALGCPPAHLDNILRGRPAPPVDSPTPPDQVLRSIRDELHSLTGKIDALLARPDIQWRSPASSDVSVELENRGHGDESSAPAETRLSADVDEQDQK
jgi:transcriptional regulator with XRE-family HTH domain